MAGKITPIKGVVPTVQPELQVQSFDGATALLAGMRGERYNPDQLAARKGGLGIYRKMRVDEQVKAVLKFKRDAIIGRGYEFVFGDTQLSPEEQKLRRCVMKETTTQMDGAFADALTGILTGMEYGFSLTEFVTQSIKVEGATYVGLAKMLTRDCRDFKFYCDDYGTLTRFTQCVASREIDLDYARFIHYVQNPHEDPYYGESELKAAYRAWFMKDLDLKFWAAFKERLAGGFLAINLGTSGIVSGSNDYQALQALLSNVRSAMGVILPNGVTAELHMPASTDAYEKAVQFHDLAIAKALLIPNLLGLSHTGQTGSYSQSSTQLEAFFMTLATDTQRLEQCLNAQLFRPLALQNWDDGEFPRFRFKKASEDHVKNIVGLWKDLAAASAVIVTPKDEAHLRELLDFPERNEKDEALAKVKQDLVPIQVDPNKAPPPVAPGKAAFAEWDESKHPRAKDGKWTAEGASETMQELVNNEMDGGADEKTALTNIAENKYNDDRVTKKLQSEARRLLQQKFSEWDESKHPRHEAGDARGGEFAPSNSAAPWEDKAIADAEWNKGKGWVARGLANILPENDVPVALAEKIASGDASASEVLGLIDTENVGDFWYGLNSSENGGTMSDVEAFAYTEDSYGSPFANQALADAKARNENAIIPTSVILVAKRPKGWSPDENPDNGLMGNSYINRKSVALEAVRYKSATGWVTKRISKTVKLSDKADRKSFSLDSALMRVDFAHIAQRAVFLEADVAEQAAAQVAKGLADLLAVDKLAEFAAQPDSIQHAELSSATVGKLKGTFRSGLERAWSTGLNQAMVEVAKARKTGYTQEDRKLRFKSLRDSAADFFDANSFRMAGNLTDGVRAIVQQELLTAVKTGLRPEEIASRIYDRLIRKGFTTLNAVKAAETREEILQLVEQLLADALDTSNVAAYLNTLTRTNTFEAMNEARYAEFSAPDMADFVVALRYSAILDDRTTEICRELDGHVHVTQSKIWTEEGYRPPNHYNCRSIVYAVTAIDGWDGVESPHPTVEPQDGFK